MINATEKSEIAVTDYIYAPDAGVTPDTGEDLSKKLTELLLKSNIEEKGIYFPAGIYLFSEDININSFNTLMGDLEGTIFRSISPDGHSITLGDKTYSRIVSNLNIERIIFDNVRIHFYGRKTNINISYNVFINTVSAADTAQLTCSTNAYNIKGNVFMRGRGYAGVGLSTYGNAPGLIIENNFLGSVNDINDAAPWLELITKTMLNKILYLRKLNKIDFQDEQGDFVAGWYSTSNLREGIFRQNYFKGSKEILLFNSKTGEFDIARDHNIYIKEYQQVEVVQNYFSGWPSDDRASGQLKFRNAKGLVFSNNYLDGISFNARPYDNVDEKWLIMKDTFIFNNFINDGMISYWQNFTDSDEKSIDVENYLVFCNQFLNRIDSEILISSPSDTLSPCQFRCAENRFSDNYKLVKTSGAFKEADLLTLIAILPDYASKYIDMETIMPE